MLVASFRVPTLKTAAKARLLSTGGITGTRNLKLEKYTGKQTHFNNEKTSH